MIHGTRQCYRRAGCHCTPCRAANADYQSRLRADLRAGRFRLGARMDATTAWARIRRLRSEATKGQIAQAIGLKRPILELHTDRITVRNHLKIQRLARLWLSDGPSL